MAPWWFDRTGPAGAHARRSLCGRRQRSGIVA
jgi:hypothetical protein